MLQLQLYVNRFSEELNMAVANALDVTNEIAWVSPLASAGYAEYRDASFLAALGLQRYQDELAGFWPDGGPCWDGLGVIGSGEQRSPLLVEAKSYPRESYSSLSAKSPRSLEMIDKALTSTSGWLGLQELPPSWSRSRYQTANRLAHLYFMREAAGLDANLVFVNFVGDPTHISTSLDEWQHASSLMWAEMGLAGTPVHTGVVFLPGLPRDAAFALQRVPG